MKKINYNCVIENKIQSVKTGLRSQYVLTCPYDNAMGRNCTGICAACAYAEVMCGGSVEYDTKKKD